MMLVTVVPAFLAGLLGSGHCFAMCGGIAASLGAMSLAGGAGRVGVGLWNALQFNLGRLFSYAVLGAISALILGLAGQWSGLPGWGAGLRILTAILIAIIGLHYLFSWRALGVIERAGGGLWRRIAPLAMRAGQRTDGAGRLLLGMCWGFLPCGLVYTVLAMAASTGSVTGGAATMLAFGLGTLPAMLGLTMTAPPLASLFRDPAFRRVIGCSLLILSLWMCYTVLTMSSGQTGHH